jgi:hypothetical protein
LRYSRAQEVFCAIPGRMKFFALFQSAGSFLRYSRVQEVFCSIPECRNVFALFHSAGSLFAPFQIAGSFCAIPECRKFFALFQIAESFLRYSRLQEIFFSALPDCRKFVALFQTAGSLLRYSRLQEVFLRYSRVQEEAMYVTSSCILGLLTALCFKVISQSSGKGYVTACHTRIEISCLRYEFHLLILKL